MNSTLSCFNCKGGNALFYSGVEFIVAEMSATKPFLTLDNAVVMQRPCPYCSYEAYWLFRV